MFARCMDRLELCDALHIDEAKLDEFIEAGIPWHGELQNPEFDEAECATWLFATGRAEIDSNQVARTQQELALKIGVSVRTISTWSHLPGFPGRTGFYPIAEIEEWDAAKDKKVNQHATQAGVSEKTGGEPSIKERRDLLKLQKEQGLLVEIEEVKRDIQRANAYAVAELNLLPGKVESKLPAGLEADLVQIIREAIKGAVKDSLTTLAKRELQYDDSPHCGMPRAENVNA